MSDDLEVHIKVDPGGAVPKAKVVEDALGKTEAAGERAKKSVKGLTDQLPKLGDAIRRESVAQQRMIELWEREATLFNQIRGPAQAYMRDLQALNNLLARGTISAREFNSQLAAIKPPTSLAMPSAAAPSGGGFNLGSLAGSLPGGSILAGAVGGGVAGAAQAGLQSAGQVVELADAYTGLKNRLQAVTGDGVSAAAALDKIHDIATRTRSGLDTTNEAFVRISLATKTMGLSQERVLSLTERLNKSILLSGAGSQEAAAGMLQLSQALSSGRLQGDELRSVLENLPTVADVIAQHLGVTRGQLRALGADGKLTSEVIVQAFEKAGPQIDSAFGKTVPTISQQFVVMKNEITLMVGKLSETAGVTTIVSDTVKNLTDVMQAAAAQTALWGEALGISGLKLSDLAGGGMGGLRAVGEFFRDADFSAEGFRRAMSGQTVATEKYGDVIRDVFTRQIAQAKGEMNDFAKAQARSTLELTLGKEAADKFAEALSKVQTASKGWDIAKEATGLGAAYGYVENAFMSTGRVLDKLNEKHREHRHELTEEEKMLDRIRGPLYEQSRGIAAVSLLYGQGAITLDEYNDELDRLFKLTPPKSVVEGLGGIAALVKPMSGIEGLSTEFKPTIDLTKLNKARTQAWLDELEQYREAAKQQADALQQIFVPLGESMIDMLYDGTKGWEDWGKAALREIEKAIAKMMILKLISSITGSTGSGGSGDTGSAVAGLVSTVVGAAAGGGSSARTLPSAPTSGFSMPDTGGSASTASARTTGGFQVVVQSNPNEIVRALNGRAGDRYYVNQNRKWNRT
jgi:tape measure domain-containing protein